MLLQLRKKLTPMGFLLGRLFSGLRFHAWIPLLFIAAFWLGGEKALMAIALGFPFVTAIMSATVSDVDNNENESGHATLHGKAAFEAELSQTMRRARDDGMTTACILVEIDDFDDIVLRYGRTAAEAAAKHIQSSLASIVRDSDRMVRLNQQRFGLCLTPVLNLGHDSVVDMAQRIQSAIGAPLTLGATTIHVTASIGLCLSNHMLAGDGRAFVDAAAEALYEARQHAPSAIRVYSANVPKIDCPSYISADDVTRAVESRQIVPWFQPQLFTDTGLVSGFEALARWSHPQRGLISAREFLPVVTQCGKSELLGEFMLTHSLEALKNWDRVQCDVPQVGVNFTADELRDPKLVKRVEWNSTDLGCPRNVSRSKSWRRWFPPRRTIP